RERERVREDVPLVQRVPDDGDQRRDDERERAEHGGRDHGVPHGRVPSCECGGRHAQSSSKGWIAAQVSASTPSTSASAVHSASSWARTVSCSLAKFWCDGLVTAPWMPSTTTAWSWVSLSFGFAAPSVSAFRSDSRGGGKYAASVSAFSGLVNHARKSAATSGCSPAAKTPMPAWPMTFCWSAGPAGSGTTSHANESSSADARLICVIVIAASPAKKSAVVPGPGIALSTNVASWTHVSASTISGSVNVHCVPSSLHGAAPQPS